MQHSALRNHGFALVTVLLMLAVLMALIAAYFMLTRVELSTTKASAESIKGFYAAEGGLNLRAEDIRAKFIGYSRPDGTSPSTSGGAEPCIGTNVGSGDFVCKNYDLAGQEVETYVVQGSQPKTGTVITIPPGEDRFAGLNAIQYKYSVYSVAYGSEDKPTAIVQMDFLSRLVPLFQFAAFYQNDLEIEPSPPMTLSGPVHTNGNLYLDPYNDLKIKGQVTTAGGLYLGQSPDDENGHEDCPSSGHVYVDDAKGTPRELTGCVPKNFEVSGSALDAWGNQIQPRSGTLTIPDVSALNPQSGNDFWDKADLRVMVVNPKGGSPAIEVRKANGSVNASATIALGSCIDDTVHTDPRSPSAKALSLSNTFYNNREGKQIVMLEVDVKKLMNCIHGSHTTLGFDTDADGGKGGMVWYFGVDAGDAGNNCDTNTPSDQCINGYGVRLKDGAELASSETDAPEVHGLTVVTNQAAYVQGDYNTVNKKPASVIADSMNILSNNWDDAEIWKTDEDGNYEIQHGKEPAATDTTVNAAFLAGTDVSDGSSGDYSGGLENYPRFHENWGGQTFTYRGSFVSLGKPLHVDGRWTSQVYGAPNRNWDYDTDFNDAAKLPPLSPRFVYLKQLLFARQFNQ